MSDARLPYFALLLTLLIALAELVRAQQKEPPASEVYVTKLLPFLSDAGLVKELSLTPEQVKLLLAHRQKLGDQPPAKNPDDARYQAARNEERTIQELRNTLSQEQFARAVQLGQQHHLRILADRRPLDYTRFEARTLVGLPDLVKALKLTADQKALLEGTRVRERVYLTAEQTESARRMLGPSVATNWAVEANEPDRDGIFPRAYRMLGLTEGPAVQAELKLSPEQIQKLAEPRKAYLARLFSLDPIEEARITADAERDVEKILQPDQLVRLRQLEAQIRAGRWSFADRWADPETHKALMMNQKQQEMIVATRAKFNESLRQAVGTGASLSAIRKSMETAVSERDQAIEASLTDAQRKRMKERYGEWAEQVVKNVGMNRLTSGVPFGRHDPGELLQLRQNKDLQSELKLTPEQQKQILASGFAPRVKGDLSDVLAKTLADVLTADQAKRYREIVMQSYEKPRTGLPDTAARYPGVAEELRLSESQRERLARREDPHEVLTPEQQVAILMMLGKPFDGEFNPRSFGTAPDRTGMRTIKEVPWTELKFTPDQATRIASQLNKYQREANPALPKFGQPGGFQPGGGFGKGGNTLPGVAPPLPNQAATLAKRVDDTLTAILSPEQRTRLAELQMQLAAAESLRVALTEYHTREKLKLTDEQMMRIIALEQDARELARSFDSFRPKKRNGGLRAIRDRLDEFTLPVLTPDQLKLWKSMTGEPCTGLAKQIPGLRLSY